MIKLSLVHCICLVLIQGFLQVVKREGNVSGYGYGQAGTKPVTGGKRSGRERLGGNANGSWLPMNKRCVFFCFFVNLN
jgi:hypothetical protein